MEKNNEVEHKEISEQKNKLATIGFNCMLAGPGILFFAILFEKLPELLANIIMWIAIVLPGIGAIMCIIALESKQLAKTPRALAIITLVMCNPFFYYCYFWMCIIMGSILAGLSWM